jgi:hypothetical protein
MWGLGQAGTQHWWIDPGTEPQPSGLKDVKHPRELPIGAGYGLGVPANINQALLATFRTFFFYIYVVNGKYLLCQGLGRLLD